MAGAEGRHEPDSGLGSESAGDTDPQFGHEFSSVDTMNALIEEGLSLDVPVLQESDLYQTCIGTFEIPPLFGTELYLFDGIKIARKFLKRLRAVESDTVVCDMAYGLACALNVRSSPSRISIHGPLVIGCVADDVAGAIIGYGVGQYHPHPNVAENGDYVGQSWHMEVRGFALDDDEDSRRIVTEYIRDLMTDPEINLNYNM
ncbi:Hypothetical predicted protein [Drosophila guanche]|uniref:Uncharacterized protein n=1 Tax=Drosophila guanche TaxID=7266 RepID=A0A3B0KKC3_DROGU|nr:Hypothetical predicted protein [Drosophila guanche]